MKIIYISVLSVVFLMVITGLQAQICGNIKPDPLQWAPVVYLSVIPDFKEINTISYDYILERSEIGTDGSFCFQSEYLSSENQLYRIHISKKGDPASSLIIGGRDHNHFFLFACKDSKVTIDIKSGQKLIEKVHINGGVANDALVHVHSVKSVLDTLDYYRTAVKRELIQDMIKQELKNFADTNSVPVAALYAINQFDYQKDFKNNPRYYRRFVRKWKSEDSKYFISFRSKLPVEASSLWWISLIILVATGGVTGVYFKMFRKKTGKMNLEQTLTIQERKILGLLKEGKTNKEIAEACTISISTVKSHVNSIYTKLNISSRKEVVDLKLS